MSGRGIQMTVSIDLYKREYHNSLQKLYDTLSVEQMKLVKQFTIDRDWFIHHPGFGEYHHLKIGEFSPKVSA